MSRAIFAAAEKRTGPFPESPQNMELSREAPVFKQNTGTSSILSIEGNALPLLGKLVEAVHLCLRERPPRARGRLKRSIPAASRAH